VLHRDETHVAISICENRSGSKCNAGLSANRNAYAARRRFTTDGVLRLRGGVGDDDVERAGVADQQHAIAPTMRGS
jgi:hypothetical protein